MGCGAPAKQSVKQPTEQQAGALVNPADAAPLKPVEALPPPRVGGEAAPPDYIPAAGQGSKRISFQDEPPTDCPSEGSAESETELLNGLPRLVIWEHVRDAVLLWGTRGGGVCQPQPLFDVISALMTVDPLAQKLCGIHQASVHMGPNAKAARALVPLVEGGEMETLSPPGKVSLSARTPLNEVGLKAQLEDFLRGSIIIEDPELLNAIHVQDVDWADVDNGAAVLSLAACLQNSKAKHVLHAFVSERRFTAEFAPAVVHRDDAGNPIKTEVMTDKEGNPIQGLQFRISTGDDLSGFEVKPSIIPFIKEMGFEHRVHNEKDMGDLTNFECAILKTQLRRAGLGDTVVGRSGVFEHAGLSGNVHKLTWYLYDHDASVRSPDDLRKDTEEYFQCGVGNASARRDLFQKYVNTEQGLIQEAPPPVDFEKFFEYCRKHPEDKIVVHCGGPLFLVRALAQQEDLRERVILIGAMFLAYDGEANLLGMNFNEGVAPALTEEVFGGDGSQIHKSFPNAKLLCVTTETCKSPCLCFVPFAETLIARNQRTSIYSMPEMHIPDKKKNQPLLIISDDGRDPDDELAKVLLNTLTQRGLVECYGFIANLQPAQERTRLSKGTLNQLGLDIPVGVGADMIESATSSYEFNVPYMADLDTCRPDGVELFVEILKGIDGKVTLVCLSGLADSWRLLKDHRELFRNKIGRVVIVGGVEVEGDGVKLDDDGYFMPDHAQNNTFDFPAAKSFYRTVQEESIPLTIVTRWAAYAARLQFTTYDAMAATGHPVGTRLQQSQQQSLNHLWKRTCMAQDDPNREGLPGRCDKAWFSKVFLSGKGQDRDGSDTIWDLASTFQAYDALGLLAALHGVRARFMRPLVIDVKGTHGITTSHEVVGMNETNNNILEGSELAEFLTSALLKGLLLKGEKPKGN